MGGNFVASFVGVGEWPSACWKPGYGNRVMYHPVGVAHNPASFRLKVSSKSMRLSVYSLHSLLSLLSLLLSAVN